MTTEVEVFRYLLQNPKLYKRMQYKIAELGVEFEIPALKALWEWWDLHYRANDRSPTYPWFYYATQHHQGIPESLKHNILNILDEMRQNPVEVNRDAVMGYFFEREHFKMMMELQFTDWSKHRDIIEKYGRNKEFFEVLLEPERIGNEDSEEPHMPFSPEAIATAWEDLDELRSERITTGHDVWDWMLGGGWPLGTFVVCHGRSGDGKTLVLGDQAINGFLKTDHIRTVFFAMDVKRKEMYARLRAKIANLPLGYNPDLNKEIYLDRLRRGVGDRFPDRFAIFRYARGKKTVSDLRDAVRRYEDKCRPLDLERGYDEDQAGLVDAIYPDYLNVIKPKAHYKEKRMGVDEVCIDLTSWAEDENKLVHTGCQANRGGNFADTLSDDHVGEHHGIKHHASFFYNLARNKQDKVHSRVRLFHSKARDEHNDFVVHMYMHKKTMSLSFNEQAGVTFEDGNIHTEWARMNPHHAKNILPAAEQENKEPRPQKARVAGAISPFG